MPILTACARNPPGDDGSGSRARGQAPLFETFWQGRLIPGSGLDSLPLVEAVRAKMRASTSGKDYLPDEVFGRIRCVLCMPPPPSIYNPVHAGCLVMFPTPTAVLSALLSLSFTTIRTRSRPSTPHAVLHEPAMPLLGMFASALVCTASDLAHPRHPRFSPGVPCRHPRLPAAALCFSAPRGA